jgi:maltose alpha-D-glucosyltransferase / alpha-amylase
MKGTLLPAKKACSATGPLWYKDAIIYELHVRAFADSNGDGIGDFQGLLSKLDYLQSLGVTCLWLLPFFPSPLRDDGYDIADYKSVHESYGTLADFREFLQAAHLRGMQVMIELVINHTSEQHPWFQRARKALKGSPERDFYVWSDTDTVYKNARIIFTDTEKSNWTWDEVAGQYYWHRFFSHQPDLNFDNPLVLEEILHAMRFWLDMGVDALRMDAIPYLVERDGTSCENLPETHAIIKSIRATIDAEYENRLILAEANQWPADVRPYFGDGDECHMAFHFPLMPRIYMALRQEDRLPITDIMAQTPEIPPSCQWGLFLRNHDELTLEMVTDDERDYMYLAYSSEPRMRINVGIRRRLAPLLDNNRRRIELLNSLLLSFPGTPILYYGDEIGMGDNIYLGDRNGVRTPMQWNSDRNAGFSKAVPARLYFPVIMDPVWGYQAINVEAQESDPSSLLHWTRNMIALRKLFTVFGRGTLEFLQPENRKVLAYIREFTSPDGHDEIVLCVANLSRFAQPVSLDLSKYNGRQPMEMLGYVPFPPIREGAYPLTLAPYSFFWLELQQATATDLPTGSASSDPPPAGDILDAESESARPLPRTLGELKLPPGGIEAVERALPEYIAAQRWFAGKSRAITSAAIVEAAPVPGSQAVLTIVEIQFSDGGSDRYQLPLAALSRRESETEVKELPANIILRLAKDGAETVIFDASFAPAFRKALVHAISDSPETAPFILSSSPSLDSGQLLAAESILASAEQSNTSILYGEYAILKLFRRSRPGENPEVEMARFLTDVAHFPGTPAYLGDIAWRSDGSTAVFLQRFAPNAGDGWKFLQGELTSLYQRVLQLQSSPTDEPQFNDLISEHLKVARQIGQATAGMHLALATPTDDPAFASAAHTPQDLIDMQARIDRQLTEAMRALERQLNSLAPDEAAKATKIISILKERGSILPLGVASQSCGLRIRIHGDYHLGQILRTQEGFLIVDFEGEPGRSLEERRVKQTPLKDVAGMLRSFSYAARSALPQPAASGAGTTASTWASAWERTIAAEFLKTYYEVAGARPDLLPSPEVARLLLRALLIEKASYELLYELNNRPAWLHLPLQSLLALLDGSTTELEPGNH